MSTSGPTTPKPTTSAAPKPTTAAAPKPTISAAPKPTTAAAPQATTAAGPQSTTAAAPQATTAAAPKPTTVAAPKPTTTAAPKPTTGTTQSPPTTAAVSPTPSTKTTTSSKNLKLKHRAAAHRKQQPWDPNLTISKSLPIFIFVGILFVSVGSVILYIFRNAEEVIIDYTHCTSVHNGSLTCAQIIGPHPSSDPSSSSASQNKCWCELPFKIARDMEAPVFLYYGLTNFYQNHRKYMTSKDDKQLAGQLSVDVSSSCKPFDYAEGGASAGSGEGDKAGSGNDNNTLGAPIAPCGAVANSMFSDTLTVFSVNHSMYVPLVRTGVAWPDLKCGRYRNPAGNLKRAFANFSKPPAWNRSAWELDPDNVGNNGFENEDFIVWMQPAALSTFRKLYRKVNHTDVTYFNGSLPAGDYRLFVVYTFPVTAFGGTKSLIVANSTVLGTKNMFLGFAYVVTGSICLIIALVFSVMRWRNKRKTL